MSIIHRSKVDQRHYEEWLDLCKRIHSATPVIIEKKADRDRRLNKFAGDFAAFCKYYFPHYIDSDFGWFHHKAAKSIKDDPNIFLINEWAREHAKSVFANVFIPIWLFARSKILGIEEITGMILASNTHDKAITLLSDLQAEFASNQRIIADYGEQVTFGDWREGAFAIQDGSGFWAFGRGQSPRGVRKAARRPNYASIDDIDDKVIVRNEKRVRETVDWILEDVLGAMPIKAARLVVSGNRIHKKSILAFLVGDIEPEDPKREGITHIKVYAIEHPRTHKKADLTTGQPAWKERFSLKEIGARMEKMGYRAARREYFHEHMEEGIIFKPEWIRWEKPLRDTEYDALEVYCDPSFKQTGDPKAIILVGKRGKYLDILFAWVRQATVKSMVLVFYDLYERLENHARYHMEANMLQDLLFDDFEEEADRRGYMLPIRADKRAKPAKEVRIENLSPLFERGMVTFSSAERQSPDMQTLIQQFLAFPHGNDDGPDAVEGAVFLLQRVGRAGRLRPRTGRFNLKSKRD